MARIKIVDLPCDIKISKEEMKKVFGGFNVSGGIITTGTEQNIPSLTTNFDKTWWLNSQTLNTGTVYLKF